MEIQFSSIWNSLITLTNSYFCIFISSDHHHQRLNSFCLNVQHSFELYQYLIEKAVCLWGSVHTLTCWQYFHISIWRSLKMLSKHLQQLSTKIYNKYFFEGRNVTHNRMVDAICWQNEPRKGNAKQWYR